MHALRASLKPNVYRDLEIESALSLFDLAHLITAAFDFDNDHAFGFFSRLTGNVFQSPVRYELFAEDLDDDALSVHQTTVAQAFPRKGSKLLFLYDYGDEWRFKVEVRVISEIPPGSSISRVTAEIGNAPEQYPIEIDH